METKDITALAAAILKHEGVTGTQTPFRIDKARTMAKWTSMFDSSPFKLELDPSKVGKGNFLHAKRPEDVLPGVAQQLMLYAQRDPAITIEKAVHIFDHTGAKGKLKFLQQMGFDAATPLSTLMPVVPPPMTIDAPLSTSLSPQIEQPMMRPKSGRKV